MKKFILLLILSNTFFWESYSQTGTMTTSSMTDNRDGKIYKTVKIGTQIWFAENLAFNIKDGAWPLNYDKLNEKKYGLLYKWQSTQKACPSGWHLPSIKEWKTLIDFVGKEAISKGALVNASGWENENNATNSSGFSSMPSGCVDGEGFFPEPAATYWTSSVKGNEVWYVTIAYKETELLIKDCKDFACFSIRCVKND